MFSFVFKHTVPFDLAACIMVYILHAKVFGADDDDDVRCV